MLTAFNVLVPVLEMRVGITSVWGAPVGKSDIVRNWADAVTEHEQTIAELVVANSELRQRVERTAKTIKIVYSILARSLPGALSAAEDTAAVPAPPVAHEPVRSHHAIARFDAYRRASTARSDAAHAADGDAASIELGDLARAAPPQSSDFQPFADEV